MPESLNAVISARGADDKINIAWIGVGTRGYAALDWLHTAAANDVRIVAICDTYRGCITRAQDRLKPIAPLTISQQAVISGHMATISFKNQKRVTWDEAAAQVRLA
jgi:hypothetical protein